MGQDGGGGRPIVHSTAASVAVSDAGVSAVGEGGAGGGRAHASHDGTVGVYFMGFCKTQAPLRERMEAMYGHNDYETDAITDYSTPASGSYYFAPSVEALAAALG